MREEISKVNKHLATEIAKALIKRVILRSEIRDEGEVDHREGCIYYRQELINRGDPRSYFDVRKDKQRVGASYG
jgi:hypothetical protein